MEFPRGLLLGGDMLEEIELEGKKPKPIDPSSFV